MGVSYKRKELREAMKLYTPIEDCLAGEQQIKSKGTQYLPMPNDGGDAEAQGLRYASYKLRAVFYGVTKRTVDGLVGQIFSRDPVYTLPTGLDIVGTDADGSGVNLVQLATDAARKVLSYGRAGLLTDYPTTEGPVSKAELDKGDIRPVLTLYRPQDIINWRTKIRGAREILSLVVLEETYDASTNSFDYIERKQWRVLSLKNDVYTVEIYRDANSTRPVSTATPQDAAGNTFNEIPFIFIGAENNDSLIDAPPMYDIASLNLAHYRNSADYEESVFLTGQPTPVFTGLTEDWVTKIMKGKVYLGSRAAISLPVGASAMLLQAAPNSLPLEAMNHKEKQMVALGARVVEKRATVRTASEANIDATNESSVLMSIAKNVSAAFTLSLKWAARYAGSEVTDKNLTFVLNTDFDIAMMSPEDRRQLIEEWMSGGISFEEYRGNLRKAGIATLPDDEAKKQIDKEQEALLTMREKLAGPTAAGGGAPAKKPAAKKPAAKAAK